MKIILSGPFCCGKTSIIKKIGDEFGIPKLIDDTTRPMRLGENQGFPYNFISEELFLQNLKNNKYIEYIKYNGNYYGVPFDLAINQSSRILDIHSNSLKIYKDIIPNIVSIYLLPPNLELLKHRAILRGDSMESIEFRLKDISNENTKGFDYLVQPNDIEQVYQKIRNILSVHI